MTDLLKFGAIGIGLAVLAYAAALLKQELAKPTSRRVGAASTPLPVAGVGRPRWLVELIRCRAGASADFELEACDATGHLRLPADLVDRSGQAEGGRHRAFA